jgi:hypothetical protein
MNNGVNKQRKKFREALIYCLTEKDIQDHIRALTDISQDKEEKTANRLKAIQLIFDYSVGKPKQDIGIETTDDEKTEYTFRIVDTNTAHSESFDTYEEYIEAINSGEISKDQKVIIGCTEERNDLKELL